MEVNVSFALHFLLHSPLICNLANALPENATVLVNHRIAVEEAVQDVKTHYREIIDPFARELGMTFQNVEFQNEKFPKKEEMIWKSNTAKLSLATLSELEPSPITSFSDQRYSWLAGTLKSVFGKDVIVAPVLEGGELYPNHQTHVDGEMVEW